MPPPIIPATSYSGDVMATQEDIDAANKQEMDNLRDRAERAEKERDALITDHINQRAVIDNLKERLSDIREKTSLSNE